MMMPEPMRAAGWTSTPNASEMRFWRWAASAIPLVLPEPVGDAVGLERVEALVVQERVGVSAGGGVAGAGGQEIGADRGADRPVVGQGLVDQVAEENRGEFGRVELVGQDHAEAVFERGVPQDGGEQEADEHRFALGFLARLGLNLFPEAIFGAVGQVFGKLVHLETLFFWRHGSLSSKNVF